MRGRYRRMATVSLIALFVLSAAAMSGAALSADAWNNDSAPGATANYTITLHAEENDSITRNGLQSVTLDFGADRDYSGELGNLTSDDVEVRVGDENGTVWAGETTVEQDGNEVTITLEETFERIQPGDRIVVLVFGVTNTEVAVPNAQSLRGFALEVSATDGEDNTDGPTQTRYSIDPSATPDETADENSSANAESDGNETAFTDAESTETSLDETSDDAGSTAETDTTADTALDDETNDGTETTSASPTNDSTDELTMEPATTEENDAGGGQATETDGPGFGPIVALIAFVAAGLLVARRRG